MTFVPDACEERPSTVPCRRGPSASTTTLVSTAECAPAEGVNAECDAEDTKHRNTIFQEADERYGSSQRTDGAIWLIAVDGCGDGQAIGPFASESAAFGAVPEIENYGLLVAALAESVNRPGTAAVGAAIFVRGAMRAMHGESSP